MSCSSKNEQNGRICETRDNNNIDHVIDSMVAELPPYIET